MQTQQIKPNKDKESHALKHTTLRRRTTYLNLIERVDVYSSLREAVMAACTISAFCSS